MIDIATALRNILNARYGRDVRQSLYDSVYQINENANEALAKAKTMDVGVAVDSDTSPVDGYVEGNLYMNTSTNDLWRCNGTGWNLVGNVKGDQGDRGSDGEDGEDGTSYYVHIRYSAMYDGSDFTEQPMSTSKYVGIYSGTSATAPTDRNAYKWASYVGASGVNSYVHIVYSQYADGTDFTTEPRSGVTQYIGIYTGQLSSPPAGKQYYTWSKYVGESGTGSGDMLKSEYATTGSAGIVDHAIVADSASGLKKSDGSIVEADSIGTVRQIFMNGATVAINDGSVDLGTVITSHQDISGKQDKSTAVTHTASTAVGGATTPVYIASNGQATALGYTIAKSVPSDAKFTDTNTWRGIQNNLTSTSTTDSLSAYQGKVLNDGKANTSGTYSGLSVGYATSAGSVGGFNGAVSSHQIATSYGTIDVNQYGKVVELYGVLFNLPTGSSITLSGFPKSYSLYAICSLFHNTSSPYLPCGSAWVRETGQINIYSNSSAAYIHICYICK